MAKDFKMFIVLFVAFFCGANARLTIFDESYDKMIAPKIGDDPVLVNISIFVLNFRTVKPKDLSFTFDLFVHQYWYDHRLKFTPTPHNENSINLDGSWKEKIWIPDMYFKNGISGEITTHSFKTTYFILHKNKMVFMASRVTADFVCDMRFRKYPHDVHNCDISLMSLSHKNTSVILQWHVFKFTANLFNTDFDIVSSSKARCDKTYTIGTYSCVSGKFSMTRKSGNYFTKYIPSFTIVIASFVGFWIPTNSYPARASVVVTSMLALITQQIQTDLKTSYFLCINIWMNLCTTIVFCCLLEFALAIIWEQSQQKELKKAADSQNEGTAGESKLKSAIRKFEKPNRNPIDQVAKYLFPILFILNVIIYFIYVKHAEDY